MGLQDNQPSCLLLTPRDYDLYKLIKKNLEELGYFVVDVQNEGYSFEYFSKRERLVNFLRKTFLRDYTFKRNLKESFVRRKQQALIDVKLAYDVCLVIRADFFSKEFLENAKKKSRKFISFHYDGLGRTNTIFSRINLFDKFYVFDPQDIQNYPQFNLMHLPNFYFDNDENAINVEFSQSMRGNERMEMFKIDFISSFHISRIQLIIEFYKGMQSLSQHLKFTLVYHDILSVRNLIPQYAKDNFECISNTISFEEQIARIRNSDIILDFCINEHRGLSFRIYEGLKFNKKVITTNENILNQDFYHPSNFFYFDGGNWLALKKFLKEPYNPLCSDIRNKYSFTNWFGRLLSEPIRESKPFFPLVSVIIPCYNNVRYIRDAIQSCWKQTYSNVEVIVVDDGSTDNSYEEILLFIQKRNNTIGLTQQNRGPSSARNTGARRASGEFLVFLDGDDKLHPKYVEECIEVFKANPYYSIVYSNAQYFGAKQGDWILEDYNANTILYSNAIPVFAMIRHMHFKNVGMFDECIRYAEDWELWIRIVKRFPGVYKIPKNLYFYRKREENDSLSDHEHVTEHYYKAYNYIYNKHIEMYRAEHLSIPELLACHRFQSVSKTEESLKFKKKYYSVWYKKFFYRVFKPKRYIEIYSNL